MINISLLVQLAYLVIGFLVVRQLFKRDWVFRCTNCRKFGTLNETLDEKPYRLNEPDILDAAELPDSPSYQPSYKCKNCGAIFHPQ